MNKQSRKRFSQKILATAIAAAIFSPVSEAKINSAKLSFTPGEGLKPTVNAAVNENINGKTYATSKDEVNELILSDGTVITLGRNTELRIENYSFDAESLTGGLTVRLVKGQIRVIGGIINNSRSIQIKRGDAIIEMDNAAATINATGDGTTETTLLYGKSVNVTLGDNEKAIVKPGFSLKTSSGPAATTSVSQKSSQNLVANQSSLGTAQLIRFSGENGAGTNDDVADSVLAFLTESQNGGDTITQPPPLPGRAGPINGGSTGNEFGPTAGVGAALIGSNQGSDSNGDIASIAQSINPRKGNTTNRIIKSDETLTFSGTPSGASEMVDQFSDSYIFDNSGRPTNDLAYQFYFDSPNGVPSLSLFIDAVDDIDDSSTGNSESVGNAPLVLHRYGEFANFNTERHFQVTENLENDLETVFPDGNFELDSNGSASSLVQDDGDKFSVALLQSGFSTSGQTVSRDEDNNFIFVEVTDPDDKEKWVFATGDLGARSNLGSIRRDVFSVTAGSEPADRAFARGETWAGIDNIGHGTTLLNVLNPISAETNSNPVFYHFDYGKGTDASTVALTIGNIKYVGRGNGKFDAILSGETIGSTLSPDKNPTSESNQKLVSISGNLASTSSGGSNAIGSGSGYADYFVIESHRDLPAISEETAIKDGEKQEFGYLRLASLIGSSEVQDRQGFNLSKGFVGGLQTNGEKTEFLLSPESDGSGLSISANPNDIKMSSASVLLPYPSYSTSPNAAVRFGGWEHTSVFASDTEFAAMGNGVALVSAGLAGGSTLLETFSEREVPDYMKWGYLFGDLPTEGNSHTHLATWIAGNAPSNDAFRAATDGVTGTATYSGSAVGNIFTNGTTTSAVGSYSNTWNFADRAGTANLNFDNTSYDGETRLNNGRVSFVGSLANEASARVAGLEGTFVTDGNDPVKGVMGQFYIQNTNGTDYRAAGTFAADKEQP